jgi:zinc transporter 1/2/3
VTAIAFHQLFEGLSLGVRIAALPPDARAPLRAALVVLFALTTPAGIAGGLLALGGADPGALPLCDLGSAGTALTRAAVALLLTQGLLSAVSAGMLIYAATVEMLAADFVLDPALARAPVARQLLALASMAAGAGGMAVVGM